VEDSESLRTAEDSGNPPSSISSPKVPLIQEKPNSFVWPTSSGAKQVESLTDVMLPLSENEFSTDVTPKKKGKKKRDI
jgi:hypothetical protein